MRHSQISMQGKDWNWPGCQTKYSCTRVP